MKDEKVIKSAITRRDFVHRSVKGANGSGIVFKLERCK